MSNLDLIDVIHEVVPLCTPSRHLAPALQLRPQNTCFQQAVGKGRCRTGIYAQQGKHAALFQTCCTAGCAVQLSVQSDGFPGTSPVTSCSGSSAITAVFAATLVCVRVLDGGPEGHLGGRIGRAPGTQPLSNATAAAAALVPCAPPSPDGDQARAPPQSRLRVNPIASAPAVLEQLHNSLPKRPP